MFLKCREITDLLMTKRMKTIGQHKTMIRTVILTDDIEQDHTSRSVI
jgi:hypothetical protein